jgi:hypothetical protein
MKTINYKGKGKHSVNELELIINQQAEELHLIKSGQKPLIIDSVVVLNGTLCDMCGSENTITVSHKGENCDWCNPL